MVVGTAAVIGTTLVVCSNRTRAAARKEGSVGETVLQAHPRRSSPDRAATPGLARRVLESLARRRSPGSILCYHGIARSAPVRSIHVSPEELAEAVAVLRRVATPVPLREIVERVRAGRSTAGLVALTFDDAYVSVATEAADFLQREAVPITLFVVTQAARDGARFWWDRLESLAYGLDRETWRRLLDRLAVPDRYRTESGDGAVRFARLRAWVLRHHAGREPPGLADAEAELEAGLDTGTVGAAGTGAGGIAAAGGDRAMTFGDRRLAYRGSAMALRDRAMTFDELDRFVASGLVDVGVHTVTHAALPLLPDEEVREEVRACYAGLRERWPGAVPVLAAPYGLVDERVVRLAREAGMAASLTLSDNTLSVTGPGGGIPRLGMSRGDPPWKLSLRCAGIAERVRKWRTGRVDASPELPA